MLRWLLLPPVVLIGLLSAIAAQTLAGRLISLAAALVAAIVLRRTKRPAGRPPTPAAGGPLWRRTRPAAPPLEQAEARLGQPLQALCPFLLHTQDRPGERWRGAQPTWAALASDAIWFLHDAGEVGIGGVWDQLPREGVHILALERRRYHHVELSWPEHARLLTGHLHGPRENRRRLLGLLAADELGLRTDMQQHSDA